VFISFSGKNITGELNYLGIFLSPFISLSIIHHALGEPLSITTFIGFALIVFGIMVQQSEKKA